MHKRCCLEAPMSTQRQIKSESLGELIFNVTRWQVEKQWNCFSLKAAQGRWVDQTKSRLEFRCFPIESILSPGLAPPKTWRVVIFPVAPFVSPESSTSGRIRRPICISLNCRNQNCFVWFYRFGPDRVDVYFCPHIFWNVLKESVFAPHSLSSSWCFRKVK